MARPYFAAVRIGWGTVCSLFSAFRREGLGPAFILVLLVFLLALAFLYLSYTPVLSPFLYPIF